MKIALKQTTETVEWPVISFKDGDKVYWNGTPFIYRRKDGEPATLELCDDDQENGALNS